MEETNPIISREKVLQAHAFDVEKITFRLPDGRERAYDLVDHANAVTLLPVDDQGCLIFVTQYRLGAESPLLELPAGVMDEGEQPEASARRELREETGQDCRELARLGGFYMAAGYSTEYMHIYLGEGLFAAPLEQDDDEFLSLSRIRELREETGQDCRELARLGGFYMAAGYSTEYMHIYLAEGLFAAPLEQDEDEFLSLSRIPVKVAYQMAWNGEIRDGKTLSALLLALPRLLTRFPDLLSV